MRKPESSIPGLTKHNSIKLERMLLIFFITIELLVAKIK